MPITNQQLIDFCNSNSDKITFCVVIDSGSTQPISIKDLIHLIQLIQSGQIT